jgi:hypothetical protein
MAIDPGLIGSVINALPIDRMISGPLNAMIAAQVSASRQYAEFLTTVCIQEHKAVQVQFDYDETLVDTEGNVTGVAEKTMRVPLLAVLTHPNINVEDGTVDFELEVSQSEESKASTEAEAGGDLSAGWGPFSVKIHAKVSHKAEQTRKTDTRAKYSFHTSVKRSGPPEGMMRVIDFLTDAATKPVLAKAGNKKADPAALPDTTTVKDPLAPPPAKEKTTP